MGANPSWACRGMTRRGEILELFRASHTLFCCVVPTGFSCALGSQIRPPSMSVGFRQVQDTSPFSFELFSTCQICN